MMPNPCISLIVACAKTGAIGRDGDLPWHLPADLKYFKAITLNKPIIMGSTTYRSIGRPLPQRDNYVLSRNVDFEAPGCIVKQSMGAALADIGDVDEIMIIGGAKIYALALPLAHRIYMTEIDLDVEGDRFFPKLGDDWHQVKREAHEAQNGFPAYSFVVLERYADTGTATDVTDER